MSPEYTQALQVANKASARFRAIEADYRELRINDAEYLAERKIFEDSQRIFDEAFAREAARKH